MLSDRKGVTASMGSQVVGGSPPPTALGRWYSRWGKRALDLSLVLPGLLVLLPVLLVLASVVWLLLGLPVLFRQERLGLRGRLFTLYKFRTMTERRGASGKSLPDAERLTALGKWMRRFSLDELPGLLNVLRGEMSLVGPRPLLPKYLSSFSSRERIRFTVPPGMTGWAQINGRNTSNWDVRLGQDVWYVENRSVWLDLKILFLTPVRVATGRDVAVDTRGLMADLDEERASGAKSDRADP